MKHGEDTSNTVEYFSEEDDVGGIPGTTILEQFFGVGVDSGQSDEAHDVTEPEEKQHEELHRRPVSVTDARAPHTRELTSPDVHQLAESDKQNKCD